MAMWPKIRTFAAVKRLIYMVLMLTGLVLQAREPLRVSLLTADAGAEVYQLEGHTALRLLREGEYDMVVNWGIFDFNSPNFLYRFVKGETDYVVAAYPYELFLEEYRREGRSVTEQELSLDSMTAERMEELVRRNLEPQNRTYRYNYVADNCATRPLAMIEEAIGDSLRLQPLREPFEYGETGIREEPGDAMTFREEMTRYHNSYPWYQFGIDLALGTGIDRPITQRQRTFSPLFLRQQMATATDGQGVHIIKATRQVLPAAAEGVCLAATPWWLTPMAVGWYLLIICVVVGLVNIASGRIGIVGKVLDTVLYGTYFLGGCLLTFLVFVSVHPATSPNWLLLWVNPLCLLPAVGGWIKRARRVVYWYQICNFVALLVFLLGHKHLGQAVNAALPLFLLSDMVRSFTAIYVNRKD